MKKLILFLAVTAIAACQNKTVNPVSEQTYVELGGEEQYVEITGASDQLPVLLFLHGGPGWPQTPHLRYFNSALTREMILVSWDQAGCGKSYMKNQDPERLSMESLVDNAHELTLYLKQKFNKEKIYLVGFSFGSVLGLQLADKYPEDYLAYIGVSQLTDKKQCWDESMRWLKEQAEARKDTLALRQLDLIERNDSSVCKTVADCVLSKYQLLVKYDGTIFNKDMAKEIEKAEGYYEDYKDYDWYEVFRYVSSRIGDLQYVADLTHITELQMPVYFMAGRHDWNLPGSVAEQYLESLEAPLKEFIWFENSGHEPPEEEADVFNETIIQIVKKHLTDES